MSISDIRQEFDQSCKVYTQYERAGEYKTQLSRLSRLVSNMQMAGLNILISIHTYPQSDSFNLIEAITSANHSRGVTFSGHFTINNAIQNKFAIETTHKKKADAEKEHCFIMHIAEWDTKHYADQFIRGKSYDLQKEDGWHALQTYLIETYAREVIWLNKNDTANVFNKSDQCRKNAAPIDLKKRAPLSAPGHIKNGPE